MNKKRILVIDDEQEIRQVLKRALEKKGCIVDVAADGSQALEQVKANVFNLLITDIRMPKLGGMEVLREIKKNNPYIEVIVMTGYPTIERAVDAIKIGAFDFLSKPFDLGDFLSVIERGLARQEENTRHVSLEELPALLEISRLGFDNVERDQLLRRIMDISVDLTGAARGSVMMLDESTGQLVMVQARGMEPEILASVRVPCDEGIAGRVFTSGEQVLVTDIEADERVPRGNKPQYTKKSFVCVPLKQRAGVRGVINVSEKDRGECFTERDALLLSVLAGQAAAIIDNHDLYQELEKNIARLKETISQLHETQNQLIQTEKMAAAGQLAYGIAHEIRNPLGIVLQGVEFLNTYLPPDDEIVEDSVTRIKQAIERANTIIVELLKFSRTSKLAVEDADVCAIMNEALTLVNERARSGQVMITRQFAAAAIVAPVDITMIRQVFFNICNNALDAMPSGGTLGVSISATVEAVEISIADTGTGMPSEQLKKIFSPFFTTKPPGKGTGLGLSIVHLIVERHGGTISADSKPGEGTTFTVCLSRNTAETGNSPTVKE